ncbi:hypothetical protein FNV43_RR19732 [Rhamnella rubrinervis]|uniref:Uncharacterized protein n=1 Tax=Rhamnella rubrinervis TaxID=2594499 RepID=A0A8K0DZC1_9ROSA|nr:hypothetical protein FNV43_RR19732 [Rhamnella rubrinervis]
MLEAQFCYTLNPVADFNNAKLVSVGSQIQLHILFTAAKSGPIGDTPGLSKLVPYRDKQDQGVLAFVYGRGEWDIAMAAPYFASDAGCLP